MKKTWSKEYIYKRLCVSFEDLQMAAKFARHILKKGWHGLV